MTPRRSGTTTPTTTDRGARRLAQVSVRTRITVTAFQRHWRQANVDGIADGETRARLVGVLQLAQVESVTGVI